MSKDIVLISGLTKTFSSASEKLVIFDKLNFSIEEGKKISITGESGSGKSTFLNILGGLESADSGEIIAGSYKVHSLDEKSLTEYRSSFLGLVFQFHYLLKDFTALENVMLPALIAGRSKKEIKEKALSLLEDVKLAERKNHFPSQLSGGERQRVAVARSLINSPSLILADEPTGNLDPANAETVQNLLFSVVDKHKKTLVLVTHDQNIASMTDISYKLYKGNLEEV
ncbi:ABC transporter ATP-binding protein [Treponema denticola]|jgi:lipoprotein-releasing system ATP-binding protein lolD|uniref:Lipoprotein-releasing system ATP-binding protein LolD n=4 Tax=Treponema denticola TaxID=158 RepID=LOLD_TREDE|nr:MULTISPECIES: ABC transporter ATP-binding protein [Treponema]Q73L25.1 RecName: Full=Lipoprotein-releasing system ATP-binding protein LolD [Treponema denticola ATCC 35405]AAS12554.1 lipoprotein releasing system, ATP-binding protein [Treponema denticola ATCC 35405]EGC77684.1 lipoprotein-releasing system ATP-binding protein lolD [Treponema denticola F0402]EMB23283.1 lipoprotein-releasing system ATP-binding protein LolD [Treponema denticola OTK]EMB26829.1 lipoprotein-releasing system ATP-bindin